jgi:phage shock protein C
MKGPTRFLSRLGLYRNVKAGWITGVCAGIADRLAIKPVWVRIAVAVLTAVAHFIGPAVIYLLLAFLMKPRDEAGAAAPAGVQTAYRDLADSVAPAAAAGRRVSELKTRFARLDARLNNLEAAVMSDELSLRRKFRDIGG